MGRETQLLLHDIIGEDRSILDLLRADFTHVNERLAKHYDIPHVYGSHIRRVPLPTDSHRGGIRRWATAITALPACIKTTFPGPLPQLRCRQTLIRAACSNDFSAVVAAPRNDELSCKMMPAFLIGSWRTCGHLTDSWGAAISPR